MFISCSTSRFIWNFLFENSPVLITTIFISLKTVLTGILRTFVTFCYEDIENTLLYFISTYTLIDILNSWLSIADQVRLNEVSLRVCIMQPMSPYLNHLRPRGGGGGRQEQTLASFFPWNKNIVHNDCVGGGGSFSPNGDLFLLRGSFLSLCRASGVCPPPPPYKTFWQRPRPKLSSCTYIVHSTSIMSYSFILFYTLLKDNDSIMHLCSLPNIALLEVKHCWLHSIFWLNVNISNDYDSTNRSCFDIRDHQSELTI